MSKNLESELDKIASYINEYRAFQAKITRQSFLKTPLIMYALAKSFFMNRPQSKRLGDDMVTGPAPALNKPFYAATATEEQKQTRYYKAFTSDYPTNAIAADIEAKYPNADFKKLKSLHDIKTTRRLPTLDMKHFAALVLGGFTLILRTVPKKVVENNLRMNYEDFEVKLFWVSIGVLAYLLFVFVPFWFINTRARSKHRFITEILEYIVLKRE